MSNRGALGWLATVAAFLINPILGFTVGLTALTAYAITEDSNSKRTIHKNVISPMEIKTEFDQLTNDLPHEFKEKLYEAVSRDLHSAGERILNGKKGKITLSRSNGSLMASVIEGNGNEHLIRWDLA